MLPFLLNLNLIMSHVLRKPVLVVTKQGRHKPDCTTTEDGQRFETSDLDSREILQTT